MTLLLLSFAVSFRFSGGSEQALADAASNQLKRTIAMLAVGPKAVRPFEFRYDDEKDVPRLLRAKSGFALSPGGGLFPPEWPIGVGKVWDEASYQRQFDRSATKLAARTGGSPFGRRSGRPPRFKMLRGWVLAVRWLGPASTTGFGYD